MGSLSIWHWLIVLAVVLLLFGGSSKISTLMGDFAKGIKSFKKNMGEDESMEHGGPLEPPPQRVVQGQPAAGYASQPQPVYQPQQGYQAQPPYPAASPAPVEPARHPG